MVDHRLQVADEVVERRRRDIPVGQAASAHVVPDEAVSAGQLGEPVPPHRTVPVVVDVGEPVGRLHQRRALPRARVGQRDAVGGAAEPDLLFQAPQVRRADRPGVAEPPDQLLPEPSRLGTRGHVELPTQRAVHPFELPQRAMRVAGLRELAHERDVRLLIERILVENPSPPPSLAQELHAQLVQPFPWLGRPVGVQVHRQQRGAVAVQHLLGRDRSTGVQRRSRLSLEPDRVNVHQCAREQGHHLVPEHDRVAPAHRPPCVVGGLVQPRTRVLDVLLGPQPVDQLLAVQPPPLRQGEHLHDRRRITPRPRRLGDGRSIDPDGEDVKKVDLNRHGTHPSLRRYVEPGRTGSRRQWGCRPALCPTRTRRRWPMPLLSPSAACAPVLAAGIGHGVPRHPVRGSPWETFTRGRPA